MVDGIISKVPCYETAHKRGSAPTLTAERATELMKFLEGYEGGKLVPHYALLLFAGIRPDINNGEISKLRATDIRLASSVSGGNGIASGGTGIASNGTGAANGGNGATGNGNATNGTGANGHSSGNGTASGGSGANGNGGGNGANGHGVQRDSYGVIHVEPEVSKVDMKRRVTIQPNLHAWLTAYPLEKYPLIMPGLTRHRAEIAKKFGLTPDILRHTFISMHVAKFRSMGDTALQAGNSEQIIRKHYLDVKSPDEACDFFGIMPQQGAPEPEAGPHGAAVPEPTEGALQAGAGMPVEAVSVEPLAAAA